MGESIEGKGARRGVSSDSGEKEAQREKMDRFTCLKTAMFETEHLGPKGNRGGAEY